MEQQVGLFFVVKGNILFHGCSIEEAENYGDFKIYNKSHFEIWDENYYRKYKVDYDFYPRGRITFNVKQNSYWIYRDTCIPDDILEKWIIEHEYKRVAIKEDEHYKCNLCNLNYVEI